jgi:hypothetical protein
MKTETVNSLEAPGRFELPNKGFADDDAAATDSQAPAPTSDSEPSGGLDRPGVVVAARERTGSRDEGWRRRAAAARWGSVEERFWGRVRRAKGEGCWLWQGRRDRDGYGSLEAFGLRHARAHRVAWQITNGPIPEGMVLCHRCDNPSCVRPDHLFVASQKENIRDSLAKGRHGSLKQAGKKRGPYRKHAA